MEQRGSAAGNPVGAVQGLLKVLALLLASIAGWSARKSWRAVQAAAGVVALVVWLGLLGQVGFLPSGLARWLESRGLLPVVAGEREPLVLFGVGIGWLTYWSLRHGTEERIVRVLGTVTGALATAVVTLVTRVSATEFVRPEDLSAYLRGVGEGILAYLVVVSTLGTFRYPSPERYLNWLLGATSAGGKNP